MRPHFYRDFYVFHVTYSHLLTYLLKETCNLLVILTFMMTKSRMSRGTYTVHVNLSVFGFSVTAGYNIMSRMVFSAS